MNIEDLDQTLGLGLRGQHRWLRADVTRGIELTEGATVVELKEGQSIIKGYSVIAKGPALGHNMLIDETTLDQVVTLGNQAKSGIKSRFDHPNASNTSMGTFIGRSRHFRRDGDRVRADLYLSEAAKEAPQGDLHSYVIALAKEDPAAFGASIVFSGEAELQKDENGKELPNKPKLARVEALLASDVVDSPAANPSGLFSHEESLAEKVTSFLNRWAGHDLMPQLVTMLNALKEDLMSEVKEAVVNLTEDVKKALLAEGAKGERDRVLGIWKGMLGNDKDYDAFAELVELGATVEEAATIYKKRRLARLTASAPATTGGSVEEPAKTDLSHLSLEDRCKAEWDKSKELREEFGSLSTYVAFKRAEENQQAKIFQRK